MEILMELPNVDINLLEKPSAKSVQPVELSHPPRFLLLYGSNRETSYSRLAVMEAGRLLKYYGADVKIFHPKDLPLPDESNKDHPKVKELFELFEPTRLFRRQFILSHATLAGSSSWR